MFIAAFDIGKKNFAFCLQEITNDELKKIKRSKNKLKNILKTGKVILFKNLDLTYGCQKKYLDPQVFINMTDTLDKFKDYWLNCSVFVIEQQMSFGKKYNPMALKLGQHCYSYFSINFRDFKKVIEFPSYHKTKVLEAPKKFGKMEKTFKNGKKIMIKDNLKKWSIRKAIEILNSRKDEETLDKLENLKKKDDASDCLLMIQAYIFLNIKDL